MVIGSNPVEVKVNQRSKSYSFKIDIENSLSVLKYEIFKETNIHPLNQIIKFGNNPLVNDLETLKSYGIKEGSIMELNFKIISNILPSSFSDKFYYKDVQLINTQ